MRLSACLYLCMCVRMCVCVCAYVYVRMCMCVCDRHRERPRYRCCVVFLWVLDCVYLSVLTRTWGYLRVLERTCVYLSVLACTWGYLRVLEGTYLHIIPCHTIALMPRHTAAVCTWFVENWPQITFIAEVNLLFLPVDCVIQHRWGYTWCVMDVVGGKVVLFGYSQCDKVKISVILAKCWCYIVQLWVILSLYCPAVGNTVVILSSCR